MVILKEEFGELPLYDLLYEELIRIHVRKYGEGKFAIIEYDIEP